MKLLVTLLTTSMLALNASAASLPSSVTQELKKARIPVSAVSIEIREVGRHNVLLSLNAQRPMNPASNMKLLTTYAGLDLLGPAYTWKTEAYIDGELKDGELDGDLILKGYGDPKFTIERFWLWLSDLRARGLRDIKGDLILDRSYYDLQPHDPAEFDNDPLRAYNVGADALLLNFNTLRLRYLPNGENLKVVSQPPISGFTLENQLEPASGKYNCHDWDGRFSVQPGGDSVVLQGDYPIECGEREQSLSIMPHTRYVEAVFRAIWQELGGTLNGVQREAPVTPSAQLFSTHRSEPLSSIIRDINKYSNNTMAKQLFLSLGAEFRNEADADDAKAAQRVIRQWLAKKGLISPHLVIENGSGLSRAERVSARELGSLLQAAWRSPYSAEFISSMPLAAVDGTMRKRLRNTPVAGKAHLKTGTLNTVRAIAGYSRDGDGNVWAVVAILNHPRPWGAASILDQVLVSLYGQRNQNTAQR